MRSFDLDFTSIAPLSKKVFLYWQSTFPFPTHKNRWRGGYAPTCYGYYPPNLPSDYFAKRHISAKKGHVIVKMTPQTIYEAIDRSDADGVPSSPLLITPVRQKAYASYGPAIGSLWTQTQKVIAKSNRMVIAGYSFPQTDTRAFQLVAKAIRSPSIREIEIVAPDALSILERVKQKVGGSEKLVARPMTLATYVFDVLAARAPEMMISAAVAFPSVRNWLERVFAFQLASIERGLQRQSSDE